MSRCLVILSVIAVTWPALLYAESTSHLDQLLLQVQKTQKWEARIRREREDRFLAAHADQQKLLAELKMRLGAERERGKQLRFSFDENEQTLSELEAELKRQTGDLGEVFGTIRQSAKDLFA
ncbi:MAG: MotA/TolQ/ExbB proton channel family protein, partial [Gammaproteobacteria bacterium]|nr:MotA/TolQ/ExbB proton channel family protein [Gammaproteobacteria bacterium]